MSALSGLIQPEQLTGRIGVSSGIELSFGYRHVEDWDRNGRLPNEERLRQMVLVPLGAGFSGRLRFEQRFNSSGSEVGFRLRPRLGFNTPINGHGLSLFATSEFCPSENRRKSIGPSVHLILSLLLLTRQ